jgi:peptide/nickel transport system substrate-binding protein
MRFSRGFSALVGGLSLGDRVIFYALAGVLAIAAVAGLHALERSVLVTVPAYGGTLVEGEVGSPRFVNPLLAITDADRDLTALAYAGLMGLTGDGTLAPVLAESYEVSPDGRTYTFALRKDAEFSDGTPVTAADVVFTVQKAQDPALKSPAYADWSGVGVEALDAQTVRFTLSKAYAPFLSLTTLGILPAHLWQSVSDEQFPFSTLQTRPVGAGPFIITKVSQTSAGLIQSVTLRANARYAPGRPYLSGMRILFFASADELARAYANGTVESAYGIGSARALTSPYSRVFGVFFNPDENQVYARAEVRKALSLAIDRAAIVEDVLGGYATPIMGPVPPGGGVRQAPAPSGENPTRAGADTLTAGGWTYDGAARVWKNKATKQTLDAITIRTSNVPELKSVASAVKADWEKLGIPVTIELYEPGDLSQNVIRPRKYGALLYGMVIDRDQDLYAFWSSQERNDPGLNIALYANKNVDSLLVSAREGADPAARMSALQQIEDTIAGEYPAAFLYAPSFTYDVPKGLSGVALPQITTPSDRFASVASWYRQTDAVWPFFADRASE